MNPNHSSSSDLPFGLTDATPRQLCLLRYANGVIETAPLSADEREQLASHPMVEELQVLASSPLLLSGAPLQFVITMS